MFSAVKQSSGQSCLPLPSSKKEMLVISRCQKGSNPTVAQEPRKPEATVTAEVEHNLHVALAILTISLAAALWSGHWLYQLLILQNSSSSIMTYVKKLLISCCSNMMLRFLVCQMTIYHSILKAMMM
jgi:hypothetical protein